MLPQLVDLHWSPPLRGSSLTSAAAALILALAPSLPPCAHARQWERENARTSPSSYQISQVYRHDRVSLSLSLSLFTDSAGSRSQIGYFFGFIRCLCLPVCTNNSCNRS